MTTTKSTLARARAARPLTAAKLGAFLEALADCGTVTKAAKRARLDRAGLYKRRAADAGFAKAWAEAEAIGAGPLVDALEEEAVRRAYEGTHRPMSVGGKLVRVREFSDALLMFLLKAKRRGVYGDKVDVGGKVALSFKIDLGDDKE